MYLNELFFQYFFEGKMMSLNTIDNFIMIFEGIQDKLQFRPSSPISAGFGVTQMCNLDCVHCWSTAVRSGREPSSLDLFNTVDQLGEAGIIKITFTGGEPFARKDFVDIVKTAKEYNMAVSILTNGTLISQRTLNELSRILEPEKDIIQVSLDAADREVYLAMRRRDYFNKVQNTIVALEEAGIPVRAHFVATDLNLHQLPNTMKLAIESGVQIFSAAPVYPYGNGKYINVDSYEYIMTIKNLFKLPWFVDNIEKVHIVFPIEIFEFMYKHYHDLIISDHSKFKRPRKAKSFLSHEHSTIRITSEGWVYPGTRIFGREFVMGNVFGEKLDEIWKRQKVPLFRDLSETKCSKCIFFPYCEGGDLQRAYEKFGTFNRPDPDCKLEWGE